MALQMQNAKENTEVLPEIKEETVYQTPGKSEPETNDDQADVDMSIYSFLLYPSKLKIVHNGQSNVYSTPQDAQQFVLELKRNA
ncbi:UNVERIFIED_CONTAM: hypothetical protein FKN15_068523 [Acipenser sinensis]